MGELKSFWKEMEKNTPNCVMMRVAINMYVPWEIKDKKDEDNNCVKCSPTLRMLSLHLLGMW